MSERRAEASTLFAAAVGCVVAASATVGVRAGAASRPAASTAATLARATQALADALAPGERTVWEHYTDPAFGYVTEDNEVKSREQALHDLKPLPPGYSEPRRIGVFNQASPVSP
jgi:hypothetical protein